MASDTQTRDEHWPGNALPRGTVVNGYRIERVLGSGGFGVTYLARDLLQQRFAIKEYFPRQFAVRDGLTVVSASAEDEPLFEDCRQRFLREAQALVRLSLASGAAAGIVRVQTYFEAHGTAFLVMDYIEGTSLASVLRETPGGLPAARVRSLLSQLLSSLRAVHRAGLMHRDLKPANIILREDGSPVLIDFGSSRELASSQTMSYTQIFTGGFAPPEQMFGQRQGEFSDIYALAAVCYRAIGGTVVDAVARQHALAGGRPDPQPPAAEIGAGRYPQSLLNTIDAALALDPVKRPQSVDAMIAALERDELADDATVVRSRPAAPQPMTRRPRRGLWAVVAGAGAATVAVGLYFVVPQHAIVAPAAPSPQPTVPPAQATSEPMPPAPASATPDPRPLPTTIEAAVRPPPEPSPRPTVAAAPPNPTSPNPAPTPAASEPPQPPAVVAVARPSPEPPPAPSPLERARALANSLSCSALSIAPAQDGLRVSGPAAGVYELDRMLAALRNIGRIDDNVSRLERYACAPITALAASLRNDFYTVPAPIAVRPDRSALAVGSRLPIAVETTQPAVYLDLYQPDGSVRHLLRQSSPTGARASNRRQTDWLATSPPGPRLLVGLASGTPLDLASRPETENTADYLAALQPVLAGAAAPTFAAVAPIEVQVAQTAVTKPPPEKKPPGLRSERCVNIVSRAQLGETLSDAELSALKTECRS